MVSDNKNPLVSILLNCYNSSLYISRAIKSVLNQSYKNWELIIWDDGSSDNSLEIIKKFEDKRIKLYSQKKNSGLGKSRISAKEKINGTLVSIIDSDDYFDSHKISKQVAVFNENNNISLCATWAKFYDKNMQEKKQFNTKLDNMSIVKRLQFINILPHSSLMYKKKSALEVGWYSNKYEYSQDYDLSLKLLNNSEFFLIKEFLTHIVQPENSMSLSSKYKFIKVEENLKILEGNLKKSNLNSLEISLLKDVIKINNIKKNILSLRNNFIDSCKKLLIIFINDPLIIFKFRLLKKISEINKI